MITLTEEQVKQLLQYLGRKPYIETAGLINMLGEADRQNKLAQAKKENKKIDK